MARKVLLIGNDLSLVNTVRSTIDAMKQTRLLVAGTGPEGMRMARSELPILAIVEFELPMVSGLETCRRLKSDPVTEDIPVVMVADDRHVADLKGSSIGGPDDLLVKPFSVAGLVSKLRPFLSVATNENQVVATGNEELDGKMGGGIPLGSLTLIEGDSGAGKSVLSQQMMYGSLVNGFALTLFSSENTIQSFVTQMASLSLSVLDYVLLGRLRVFPIHTSKLGKDAPAVLLRALREERHSDMLFVDSLTSSIPNSSNKEVLGFFEESKRICTAGQTVVIIVHSHGLDQNLLIRIRSLCDAHLQLHTEDMGKRLVKALTVTKVRGADRHTGNIVSFEVEPGWGIRVIPINKVGG